MHAHMQKVLSEGVQLDNTFFLFKRGGRIQQAIIGPPAKRHLNDDGQALNSGFVLFGFSRGSGPVLLKKTLIFVIFFFWGGGGSGPLSPSGSAHGM